MTGSESHKNGNLVHLAVELEKGAIIELANFSLQTHGLFHQAKPLAEPQSSSHTGISGVHGQSVQQSNPARRAICSVAS
jgi:hypothetical protein